MEFDWSKYKLSKRLKFDSPVEYMLILANQGKLLITYKSSIKIYNINTLNLEGEINLENIKNIENLYLLTNGLISICTKKRILLIELNEDNTFQIIQTIESPPDFAERLEFKYLIELKNSNLCILSKNKIFLYKKDNNNKYYTYTITLIENYVNYDEKGENESCIELIYPEKNIENKLAVYLSNVSRLSFWDLNTNQKINNTDNNYCNTFDCKDMFCLMDKGKYLLCACIDETISFYSTESCELIKTLSDCYWHITVLKLGEDQILSGGDFGNISFYKFDFEQDEFKKQDVKHLDMEKTKNVEKVVDLIVPEELKENNEEYGHGKAINEIRKYGDTIISSSCFEKDDQCFICFWNKE